MDAKSVLINALKAAGRVIRAHLSAPLTVTRKDPVNLVTQVDHQAERAILKIIKRHFPDHSIVTEESDRRMKTSPFTWIIDPLDGTTNFVHHIPYLAVSIALYKNGKALHAGVLDPWRNELFSATAAKGAKLNGRSIRVSRTARLGDAAIFTGFSYDRRQRYSLYTKPWKEFMMRAQVLRWYGAAALDLCWVACGRADAFWEWNLQPWDSAAGALIVREAGGRMTDFKGKPHDPFGNENLASNRRLHASLLSVFRKVK